MTLKVGINGYGRIGRNVLRALYESAGRSEIRIVAVNDLGDAETNAHLTALRHRARPFPRQGARSTAITWSINGDRIQVLAERDPSKLPWGELGVDIVLECTGPVHQQGRRRAQHVAGGAKKVIISAPGREGRRRHHRLRRKSQDAEGWT